MKNIIITIFGATTKISVKVIPIELKIIITKENI